MAADAAGVAQNAASSTVVVDGGCGRSGFHVPRVVHVRTDTLSACPARGVAQTRRGPWTESVDGGARGRKSPNGGLQETRPTAHINKPLDVSLLYPWK